MKSLIPITTREPETKIKKIPNNQNAETTTKNKVKHKIKNKNFKKKNNNDDGYPSIIREIIIVGNLIKSRKIGVKRLIILETIRRRNKLLSPWI